MNPGLHMYSSTEPIDRFGAITLPWLRGDGSGQLRHSSMREGNVQINNKTKNPVGVIGSKHINYIDIVLDILQSRVL